MGTTSGADRYFTPAPEFTESVRHHYDRGRVIDAMQLAESAAPLARWNGTRPCIVAARIAAHVGAPGLSLRLAVRAWKFDRSNAEATMQLWQEVLTRRGALALWLRMRNWAPPDDTPRAILAEWLGFRAHVAGFLRDFATAETLLTEAEAMRPDSAWVCLQRAYYLEKLDKPEEALAITKAAINLHPHPCYRPATQFQAHLLQILNRDEDAIHILSHAADVLQNSSIQAQLYSLLHENKRWEEAATALDRYEATAPLMEASAVEWLHMQRVRVLRQLGRFEEAAAHSAQVKGEIHQKVAERLRAPHPAVDRVELDVSFVRQHFKTCAPATFAAIGRFWKRPADHLALAEAMCYDGTPHWQQRKWAEENGWRVREFRVTRDSAIGLLEQGWPFAISTVEATSAHMMAVVGIDHLRDTLLLRDPGQPYVAEAVIDPFLERYQAHGPHGMLFVPAELPVSPIESALPEAALYDLQHRAALALERHDRTTATAVIDDMAALAPESRLLWETRSMVAGYDANLIEQLRCLEALLTQFPGNPQRLLARLACLRDAPRDDRIAPLVEACAKTDADPALCIAIASNWIHDARSHDGARGQLARALRHRPLDANAIQTLADLEWEAGNVEVATELYGFAANLEEFHEGRFQTWFIACRRTRRTDGALKHLKDRFQRFGAKSAQPALTLAWTWQEMDDPLKMEDVLAKALLQRPDDGYLALRAAGLIADRAHATECEELLARAKGRVRESDWLRARAEIDETLLAFDKVLLHSRAILELEPLAMDAHAGVARALSRLEGPTAALNHVKQASAQWPRHCTLLRMVIEWSQHAGPGAVEAAVRTLLAVEPHDAWARRERAMALVRLKRTEEAVAEATEAARIEPRNSYSYSILGHVCRQAGMLNEAVAHYRRAVELSVDNTDAVSRLVDLTHTDTDRRRELVFIENELIRQVVTGDGLLAYLDTARNVLEPAALLQSLRTAHAARPDLWHSWSVLISQLGHMGQLDEALELARRATQRFPHLPKMWLDLARIHRWRNAAEEEIAATSHAFEINPGWTPAAIGLANALERAGRLADSDAVCRRALRHLPREAQLHAFLATIQRQRKDAAGSRASIEQSIRLDPAQEWAWDQLASWAAEDGQSGVTQALAMALSEERPGEAISWMNVARSVTGENVQEERLRAVERALALNRRYSQAWDFKAHVLAELDRFDEALAACQDGLAAVHEDGHILQGRHAWILHKRGRNAEAIEHMQRVVTENSAYAWGWVQLASWLIAAGKLTEATQALQHLRELNPHDMWTHRQLGLLLLRQEGKKDEARAAFATALQLDPTDPTSGHNLLQLQLEADDRPGANHTLQLIQLHQPGPTSHLSEVLVNLHLNKKAEAETAFEALCACPDPDPFPPDRALRAFRDAKAQSTAKRILTKAVKSGRFGPQIPALLIPLHIEAGSTDTAVRVYKKLPDGEAMHRGLVVLLQGLGNMKAKRHIVRLKRRETALLHEETDAWAQMGYALCCVGLWKEAASWMDDWQKRPGLESWTLFNHCLALRNSRRYTEASVVAQYVVDNRIHRPGAADMRLFLAVEEALKNNIPVAADHLEKATLRDKSPYDKALQAMAKGLIDFLSAPEDERSDTLPVLRRNLKAAINFSTLPVIEPDVQYTLRRMMQVIANAGGGWKARLWFEWQFNLQFLIVLAFLTPFAVVIFNEAFPSLGWRPGTLVGFALGVGLLCALCRKFARN